MTELAMYQPSARDLAITGQNAAFARLTEWAESAQAAYEVARRLVDTAFVPVQYRGKPAEATAAILAGSEVGLSPMSSLRAFDNIQGVAAPKAITLRAVVQSFGHDMVLVESTETRCVMRGRRKGTSEWQQSRWTLDRAKALGLTGKDNWKKQPGAMLVARATSELARLIGADAILGIGYSSEELADGVIGDDTTEQGEVQTGTRRMSRIRPVEDTPLPDPEPAANEPVEAAELITGAQSKKLHALYREIGIEDRAARLEDASGWIDRKITSSAELTKDEASSLIDRLELMRPDEDAPPDGPDPWSTAGEQP